MDHSGITTSCYTCHNGSIAPGKPANHIQSLNTCESCHRSTANWGSVSVEHGAVTGSCVVCHNGVIAPGKPSDHPVTSNNCEECHNTRDFDDADEDDDD